MVKNHSNLGNDHQLVYIYYTRLKNINFSYTITPIGLGGHFFNVILFFSKIGIRDQTFQDELNLQFQNHF